MKGKVGNPAPKGNNYAEKWSLEAGQKFYDDVLDFVEKNSNCSSLAKASVECGHYENVIDYLRTKFGDELDFDSIKKAQDIIKARLIQKGLENEYNPTMSIFILKNNHGMKDKVDVTSNDKDLNKSIPVVLPDGKSLDEYMNELEPE